MKVVKVADRHLPKGSFDAEELFRDCAGKGRERQDPSLRFNENRRKLRVQVRFWGGERDMTRKYLPGSKAHVRSGRGYGYWKWRMKEGKDQLGPFFVPGCFIASAVYGTPLAPEIAILRNFRDKFLLKNELGKEFVNFYYQLSPQMADFISKHLLLRKILRETSIKPITKVIKFLNM